MKKLNIALIIGFVFTLAVCNISSFAKSYDNLKNDVVRLHILANSDSEEDQALKLKVRDKILETSGDYFSESASVVETEKIIEQRMSELQQIAQQEVYDNGYDYKVSCKLVNMYFDERQYDNFSLPAGNYDAFRITIGDAKGHNWWCVMYPPLCIPAAMDETEFEDMFTDEEVDMITNPGKYKVKFKIVELYEKLTNKGNTTELEKQTEIH